MLTLTLVCSLALVSPGLKADPSLRSLAERAHTYIGCCVNPGLLASNADDGKYGEVIAREMNLVEPENDLKPPAIWQGPDKYNFGGADVLLGAPGTEGWAQRHKVAVRGHVLLYARDQGYTIPGWLLASEKSLSEADAKRLLHDYIAKVAGRYKGKISMWDVINEAIDDAPNDRPFNLRDSFWYRKLGKEFLPLAFQYAHEADPHAKLYYNDYNIEWLDSKARSAIELAEYVRKSGAHIDGIGLQYHIQLGNLVHPDDEHYKMIHALEQADLSFMITELDVAIKCVEYPPADPLFGLVPKQKEDLAAQAEVYRSVFQMALSSKNCKGVQLWGITDRHSWIPQYERGLGAALEFDGEYRTKPAYDAIRDVLGSR